MTLALFRAATADAARIGEHLIDVGRRGVCERVAHFILELVRPDSRSTSVNDRTPAFTYPFQLR